MTDQVSKVEDKDTELPVGVVVIGRNEGERLNRCLRSLVGQTTSSIVYVDSGSTDNSVELAKSLGVDVVDLDISIPFTMSRGRNTGFKRLLELQPDLEWVQFVDGDCEFDRGWIGKGLAFLRERPDVAVVCGIQRERYPDATLYNRLIDLEWQGPFGEIRAPTGNALFRADVFRQSGGFDETMIAGEEPELCLRIRRQGGLAWRLNADMALHDAAMTSFRQWWRRMYRGGHAFAQGFAMHGGSKERFNRRQVVSALVYGLVVPGFWAAGIVLGWVSGTLPIVAPAVAALTLAAYMKCAIGAFKTRLDMGNTRSQALFYSVFCVIGKFSEAFGILKYYTNRIMGKHTKLIEYKSPAA